MKVFDKEAYIAELIEKAKNTTIEDAKYGACWVHIPIVYYTDVRVLEHSYDEDASHDGWGIIHHPAGEVKACVTDISITKEFNGDNVSYGICGYWNLKNELRSQIENDIHCFGLTDDDLDGVLHRLFDIILFEKNIFLTKEEADAQLEIEKVAAELKSKNFKTAEEILYLTNRRKEIEDILASIEDLKAEKIAIDNRLEKLKGNL